MRTTITLDKDVERMLKEQMHRTRQSFKATLNDAIRIGLRRVESKADRKPFKVKAKAMGLRPGYDPAGFNKLLDELEAEAFAEISRRNNST